MDDKYEIFCLVNDKRNKARILLNEEQERYKIKFEMETCSVLVEAENYFYALIELRKRLETEKIKLLCKGCSRYVYPSPMILGMGDAIEAYELTLGKHATVKNLVNIFSSCELDEYATIEEQLAYYEEWLKSKKE
ncbi:MAG: hypothetical protein IJN92_10500 [Lachnospiraceae bacterium]|nr:hypothetical protein [Lachnospiraceae bacterium]